MAQAVTSPKERVQAGVAALVQWYLPSTGLYRSTGWWNSANATTTLVDAMRVTGDRNHEDMLATTLRAAQVTIPKEQRPTNLPKMTGFPGFLNEYYDDEGWWALAWIDAYDLTGKPEYLAAAQAIFHDMQGGWDATCGGGIWWSKERTYKNAIANELFFDVGASLANRGSRADRKRALEWAAKEWRWFQSTGMVNPKHLVNDGLAIDKTTGACSNNGHRVWTYNQGVVLGALTEYARATRDKKLLADARVFADAGLENLTDEKGVLHDGCEPCGGEDAYQFKGIFVRNLRILDAKVEEPRYREFFAVNAESIWTKARDEQNQFSVVWNGPMAQVNAGSQSSALDALVAAASR